jgi:hypothetical protein
MCEKGEGLKVEERVKGRRGRVITLRVHLTWQSGVPSFLCYLFLHLFTLNKKKSRFYKKKYLKNRKLYNPFLEVDDDIENTVSYVNIKYGNSFELIQLHSK